MSLTIDLRNEEQAAKILHVAVPTLRRWRQLRAGPPYVKLGRRVFYADADIAAYVKSQRREPGGN